MEAHHSLAQIARCIPGARLLGDGTVRISHLHHDSRHVEAGTLFVVRTGHHHDGRQFVHQALKNGAVALLTADASLAQTLGRAALVVDEPHRAAGHAAAAIYGPVGGDDLSVIGVTGTNGKTTVTFLVAALLRAVGARPAQLGTLGGRFFDHELPNHLTTPEAADLARTAAKLRSLGATHLALEVSSHSLVLGRVEAVRFQTAVFTNLSRDHLDFHKTMEAYGAAKSRLFTDLAPATSVINVDDSFGATLVPRAHGQIIRVSPGGTNVAEVAIPLWTSTLTGSQGVARLGGREYSFTSPLLGDHNRENIAVALGVLVALRYFDESVWHALAEAPQVPGRLERCSSSDDDVTVFVDYAHTPDALARTLGTLRAVTPGNLWCVFGCGGDRDPGKRAVMGAMAAAGADRVVVTDDNPRSEDPALIAHAILSGVQPTGRPFVCIHDRAEAIAHAITSAAPGDTIVVAGKGHETHQIVGTDRRPFEDREHAVLALAQRLLSSH